MTGANQIQIELVVPDSKIELAISAPKVVLDAGQFGNVPILSEKYEGDYTVIPDVAEQTLATANKLMEQDVVIKSIPYNEVSNLTGGTTFYIGKEVED